MRERARAQKEEERREERDGSSSIVPFISLLDKKDLRSQTFGIHQLTNKPLLVYNEKTGGEEGGRSFNNDAFGTEFQCARLRVTYNCFLF